MICIPFIFAILLSEAWSIPGVQWRVTRRDQDRQATIFRPTRELETEDRMSRIRSKTNGSSTLISEEVSSLLQINENPLNSIEDPEDSINPGYKDQRKKKQQRNNRMKRKNKKRMKTGKGNRVRASKGENDIVDSKGSQKESGEIIADNDDKEEEPMDEENKEEEEKENDHETETDMPESTEIENIFAETNTIHNVTTEKMNPESDVATKDSGWWERTKDKLSSIARSFSNFLHNNL